MLSGSKLSINEAFELTVHKLGDKNSLPEQESKNSGLVLCAGDLKSLPCSLKSLLCHAQSILVSEYGYLAWLVV